MFSLNLSTFFFFLLYLNVAFKWYFLFFYCGFTTSHQQVMPFSNLFPHMWSSKTYCFTLVPLASLAIILVWAKIGNIKKSLLWYIIPGRPRAYTNIFCSSSILSFYYRVKLHKMFLYYLFYVIINVLNVYKWGEL